MATLNSGINDLMEVSLTNAVNSGAATIGSCSFTPVDIIVHGQVQTPLKA